MEKRETGITNASSSTLYALSVCMNVRTSHFIMQTAIAYSATEAGVQAVEKLKLALCYVNTIMFGSKKMKAERCSGHNLIEYSVFSILNQFFYSLVK